MTTFKTILLILKENRIPLAIGLVISIGISFLYAENLSKNNDVTLATVKIAIFNRDHQDVSNELTDFLTDAMQQIELADTQSAKDDALYFSKVDYILTIPPNFSADFLAGKEPRVDVLVRPGSYSQTLADTAVNHFLNTYSTYQGALTEATPQQILSLTQETLAVSGAVELDASYAETEYRNAAASIFNFLAYGLFTTVFSGLAVIYLTFNRPAIRMRNLCSPVSSRKLTRIIFISSLTYSLAVLAVFLIYDLIYTKSPFDLHTLFFVLNACIFFIAVITFSLMVCSLSKNQMIVSIINNTFIMGSCFISGVYVPVTFLPELIVKISMLTPTYWFTETNRLIAETTVFNEAFYQKMGFHFAVLLCFSAAFLVVNRIRQKETGGLQASVLKKAAN